VEVECTQLYSRLLMCTESEIEGSKSSVVFGNEYSVCRLLLCSGVNVYIRKKKTRSQKESCNDQCKHLSIFLCTACIIDRLVNKKWVWGFWKIAQWIEVEITKILVAVISIVVDPVNRNGSCRCTRTQVKQIACTKIPVKKFKRYLSQWRKLLTVIS
jgi:hypothetical protein